MDLSHDALHKQIIPDASAVTELLDIPKHILQV